MNLTMLDYEVLVRQKRDAMLADTERRRKMAQRADGKGQGGFGLRALVATLLGRTGARDQKTVATQAA